MALQHSLEIKGNGLNALANVLHDMPSKLPKEIASVANKVASAHAKAISREVRKELATSAKEAGRAIKVGEKATATKPSTRITVQKMFRPSLKAFGARQTKKGVSYKISKRGKRQKIASAFVVQKLGGHVFKRSGRERYPIVKLKGPSVWGVYLGQNLLAWSQDELGDELGKQIERRIRAIKVSAIKRQGRAEGLSTDQINQRLKEQL